MNHQDFLAARQSGIGGSDIAAILGLSKFKTALDVYHSKTAPAPEPEKPAEHLYWGHALEAPIAARFGEETGYTICRQPEIRRHPQHDWAIANADGLILAREGGEPVGILEIKTSSAYAAKSWSADDAEHIPVEYFAQVQWYLEIFDLDMAYLAVLIGGSDYRHYRIERDRELAAHLIEQGSRFWHDHVLANIPPAPQTPDDLLKLYPQDSGDSAEADTETLIAYNELTALKAQMKILEGQIAEREDLLKTKIGQHAVMRHNGQKLFSWKTQSSNRFDSKRFQAAHPDLYQQFLKPSETRVLRISAKG